MASDPCDTSPTSEEVRAEGLRRMPAWRKLALVGEMNRTLDTLALAGLRRRYPEAGAAELRRRLADIRLGPALAARVYGPPPAEPPR